MKPLDIKTIGVIGAGTMGQGIAQTCAAGGFQVQLYEINENVLAKAIQAIENNTRMLVDRGKLSIDQQKNLMASITPINSVNNFQADLIIEAIVEDLSVKRKLFSEIENSVSGDPILATNTSSLGVGDIAADLKRPELFCGIHFFNPAPLMKLVEVVSGEKTNPVVINAAIDFLRRIGKVVVASADTPGFIVNRVARHFYLESLKALEEGVSDVNGIDTLMRSAGFKMGPFELMDLIGIDINYAVSSSVYEAFGKEIRFKPSDMQAEKVASRKLGRKTGEGFYRYEKGS